MMSSTPANDTILHAGPLDTLAEHDRRQLVSRRGRRRRGVRAARPRAVRLLPDRRREGRRATPTARARRMKVQVARSGVDRAGARDLRRAHLRGSRLGGAAVLRARGADPGHRRRLRVTSYLAADPEDPSRVKIVLSGEASRLDPGEATVQLARPRSRRHEAPRRRTAASASRAATACRSRPMCRSRRAATSSAWRSSTARAGSARSIIASTRVAWRSARCHGQRSAAAARARAGPRRAPPRGRHASGRTSGSRCRSISKASRRSCRTPRSMFEIATTADGPVAGACRRDDAPATRGGSVLAQGVSDMRVLPPGQLRRPREGERRATASLGEVRRPFTVTEAPLRGRHDRRAASPAVVGDRLAWQRADGGRACRRAQFRRSRSIRSSRRRCSAPSSIAWPRGPTRPRR